MQDIKPELLKIGKVEINTLLITVFLSGMVLASLWWQNIFIIFAGMLIVSAFFIWQTPLAGMLAVLLTTMIFGEHFSLLPLRIEDTIYKIYALDFVLLITFLCWLLQSKIKRINLKNFFNLQNKNFWLVLFFIFIILNLFRSFLST
ncbi:hypothetical protein ACFL1Y_01810, partial [Patescibacteria group bacterium]